MDHSMLAMFGGVIALPFLRVIGRNETALARLPLPTAPPAARSARASPSMPAGLSDIPDLSPIEWDGPAFAPAVLPRAVAAAFPEAAAEPVEGSDEVRNRYIAARFPGVAKSAADLEDIERIIKAARLYFEEGKSDRALELLKVAIRHCPGDEALRLAQLEVCFLAGDGARYRACAAAYLALLPASPAWPEIARLGRTLLPGDAAFGATETQRDHAHYGPWPDMPNWIQASWDLTAEVLAADFHRAMARRAEAASVVQRNVA